MRFLTLPMIVAAALAAALPLAGCNSDTTVRELGTRAVVIGIDGADWKVIDALADEGALPNLSRLRTRGTWGEIATLPDIPLSPVIWTSIATGKTAVKHGVAWFMVDGADGKRVPVRSHNRKTKAIWNILAEHRRRPVTIGWWATYPAEDVGEGIVVSDGLGFHGFGATARRGEDRRKTHPAALFPEVDALLPSEREITPEFAGRFLHLSADEYRASMYDPAGSALPDTGNPIHLFQQYAATAQGYTAIAEKLLGEPYDLFMLYFEQVDSFSHLFMKYEPPQLPWVDEEGFARYRDVVREWYRYQDELLGRLLDRIDLEKTAVFLVSDHGFKTGSRRIRSEQTVDVRKAHLDHETLGIFLAAGPHIGRGGHIRGASVLDMTPTLLHYLGFAIARDMDGQVLAGIFEPEFRQKNPIRWVETYEDEGSREPKPAPESEEITDAEMAAQVQALRSLGYLGSGSDGDAASGAGASDQRAESSPEIHNNLGRIHLSNGDLDKAQGEFEQALALDPNNAESLLNMGSIRRVQGRVAEAEHLVKRALQVNPNAIGALGQMAEIQRVLGDLDESIRLYGVALDIDDSQPSLYLGLGDSLQRAGRHDEAERAFRSVLELDPDSFDAYYNLGVTSLSMERFDDAAQRFEKSLELAPLHPHAALALNNLGDIHLRRGETDRAMERFRQAVDASPGHLESRYNLAVLHLQERRIDDAIPLLEEAAALAPDHEMVAGALGMAYLLKGRNEDAYKSFLLVRRLYPQNWIAPLGLALLHAGGGETDRARELLTEAVRLGGQSALAEAKNYPVLQDLLTDAGG